MNSSNAPALFRSLIVYAICVPLAIFVGYYLASFANSPDYSSMIFLGILGALLVMPILLRWHYPLLIFSWSAPIILFFIPGTPNLWIVMVMVSLGLSILERIIASNNHFVRVPQITWPLIAFTGIVVLTAYMNGGFGLRAAGSSTYGGRKYITLFLGIASYFALTSRAIPANKARLYAGLYFLGAGFAFIGDTYPLAPSWLEPIYWVFRPSNIGDNPFEVGVTRLGGVGGAAVAVFTWLVARHGLRGIFMEGKLWRPLLLGLMGVVTLLGGYRTSLWIEMLIFGLAFFIEGLHRTWLLAPLLILMVMGAVALVPLASHLPFTFQRALAFLPLELDSEARASADASTGWRFNMWTALLQEEVPQHLLLGKGYAFSSEEYGEMMNNGAMATAEGTFDAGQNGLALAGDYHNGMLSLVIPFGIWGVLAFLWYAVAGLWVMYRNMRYGREELRTINNVLFIVFLNEFVSYVSCFGGLAISGDMAFLNGMLGMSVALNNGVCRPQKTSDQAVFSAPERALLPAAALQS
jgi:hypothetical protein